MLARSEHPCTFPSLFHALPLAASPVCSAEPSFGESRRACVHDHLELLPKRCQLLQVSPVASGAARGSGFSSGPCGGMRLCVVFLFVCARQCIRAEGKPDKSLRDIYTVCFFLVSEREQASSEKQRALKPIEDLCVHLLSLRPSSSRDKAFNMRSPSIAHSSARPVTHGCTVLMTLIRLVIRISGEEMCGYCRHGGVNPRPCRSIPV